MDLVKKIKLNQLPVSFSAYLLVVLAIATPWFLKPGYLFLTDNIWGPNIRLDWTSPWFLFNLLVKGLSFIFPVDFIEKVFIAGVFMLILLGGRILVESVLKKYNDSSIASEPSRSLVFVISLFALFNPFVYDRALYGQFGALVSYGSLLFVAAYLFRAWEILDFRNIYLAAIFSAIALLFSVHFIFFLFPFYLLFLAGLLAKRQEIRRENKFKRLFLTGIFSLLIFLVINANWLAAVVVKASSLTNYIEKGITSQDLVAFQTAGETSLETFTNVLMMSGFWGKDQHRYFDLTDFNGWQRSFIFLLPIIFYGVYLSFRGRNRETKILSLALILIFGLAVLLAIGNKLSVTRPLTIFFYNYLPLYKGLREPQKWVAVVVMIYIFYLTIGSGRLFKKNIISNNRLVSGLIMIAVIIMQAPSLLWGFNRQAKPISYPKDWYEVNSLLVSRSDQSRGCHDKILFLPWHAYMSFNWLGKIVASPAQVFFTCPAIIGTNMEWGGIYDNSRNPDSMIISDWISVWGAKNPPLVSGAPIRYIILAKEIDFPSYFWLNNLSYLKLIRDTETLFVYEIKY